MCLWSSEMKVEKAQRSEHTPSQAEKGFNYYVYGLITEYQIL